MARDRKENPELVQFGTSCCEPDFERLFLLIRSSLCFSFWGKKSWFVIRMDAILNYRLEETEDYYSLLGCDELSSVEQILAEFKVRALQCHPDKHPENSKASETFQKLQKAKEVLTNEDSRARYDHWRRSQVSMPFQQWEALSDSVKTSMHWAVRGKKDLMLEETDQTHTSKVANEEQNEQREEKKEEVGSATEKTEQREMESLAMSFSPRNPDSSTFSDVNSWHLRFRWSGDAPSELLRKFRNYEI